MTRILLCDDSNMILKIMDKRLRDAGFDIVGQAKDGNECIQMHQQLNPDLLLLDITMPNKDGRECLVDILAKTPKAKIIMVSALSDQAVFNECLAQGAKAFINKSNLSTSDDFNQNVLSVIKNVLQVP